MNRQLEIRGVGYKAHIENNELVMTLGFSHLVHYSIPTDVSIAVEREKIISVDGNSLQRVGQVAAEIRQLKKPEPYKGKGIRYLNENVLIKSGKKK